MQSASADGFFVVDCSRRVGFGCGGEWSVRRARVWFVSHVEIRGDERLVQG